MLINNEDTKEQFRTEFLTFLTRNKFNLMSFLTSYNDEVNTVIGRKGNIRRNYGTIHQRLHSCSNIDIDFFQTLIHLADKDQFIQFIGKKVVISKRF